MLYHDFTYQAASWRQAHRAVAKVERHQGELFPRVGFVVTYMSRCPYRFVQFYNRRGVADQWIKEGKHAVHWTRLSCPGFVDNQVRLQLVVLAYNLRNFLRRFALPPRVGGWTLTAILDKLIRIGAKMVRYAGCVTFPMAEVAVPRSLFRSILMRIRRMSLPPPTAA